MLPVTPELEQTLCLYEGCSSRWTIAMRSTRGYCSKHAWVLLHDKDDPRKPVTTIDLPPSRDKP